MSGKIVKVQRCTEVVRCFGGVWPVLVLMPIGAHFYRAGEYGLVLCVAGFVGFLCSSAAWKRAAAGLFLFWSMLEWFLTAHTLLQVRLMLGEPWLRGTLILVVLALMTGLTGAGALHRAMELARKQGACEALLRAATFMGVFLCLYWLRESVSTDFLLLERYVPYAGGVQIFSTAWYGSFAAGVLADPRRSRKWRFRLWLLFGVVFFVQFFLGVAGLEEMLLTGRLHVPIPAFILYGAVFRDSLTVMPFIAAASALLAGSAWCSLFCYWGPFDALAAHKRSLRPLPPRIDRLLRCGRPVVLVGGVAAALVLSRAESGPAAIAGLAAAYAAGSFLIMLMLSRRYGGMLHCGTVCPLGLVISLLGWLSPWRLRVDTARCDNCGACEKICRWRAMTPECRTAGKVLSRCTLCRECLSVCPRNAPAVTCPGLAPELAGRIFVGMTAGLHAVFMSTAMV